VEEGTSEHYTFAVGEPVISENIDDEERFRYPEFMKRHDVKAFVNVPIIRSDGETAYGILEVDSKTSRAFSEHDITFLRTYANLLAATVVRLQMIQRLERAVLDKERLFIESQHRTKNNLQLISSFVRLRLKRASSEDAREHLLGLSSRIETIHILHEKLYSTGDLDSLDLAAYLTDLAGTLLSVQPGGPPVDLQISVQSVVVKPEIAIPVGLILNEFMTNSLKHAFDDDEGVIGIELIAADDSVSLRIWDNGKGLPDQPDVDGGTGISLINALARQINASPKWSSEGGTSVILTLHQ
jgi:two-component sensor histidine kinase